MAAASPLERLGEPLFHRVSRDISQPPDPQLDASQRVAVRTLDGMQKEAVVRDSRAEHAWRLASDEGDYLDGDDVAPCPLSFLMTGLAASVTNRIETIASDRGVDVDDVVIKLDTFYTMQGSALRGDMTGGALPPEFDVTIEADASAGALEDIVASAVETAPVTGYLPEARDSRFSLSLNGAALAPQDVESLDRTLDDPLAMFEELPRDRAPQSDPIVRHTGEQTEDLAADERYTAGAGSSLEAEQDRILHLRATCTRRDDRVKRIEQRIFSPRGSKFVALSDESGRAPGARSYAAAGIAFCFMTQFGRYADIVDKQLDAYRIVQETQLGVDTPAAPVATHVFLESPEGEAFAREILDMSEQTCFLHALCRTALQPELSVSTR